MGPDLTRALHKLLAPIRRRIALMLARGVGRMVNASTPMQKLQVEVGKDDLLDAIEHLESYGLTAHPLPGYEAFVVSLRGDRGHSVALATPDRRHRKQNLAAGEVALYTDEGDYILLKRGRIVEVFAGTKVQVTAPDVEVIASVKVQLTTPLVECSTDLKVNGTATVVGQIIGQGGAAVAGNVAVTGGDVTADSIGLKTHVHGGVAAGGALTGVPQ